MTLILIIPVVLLVLIVILLAWLRRQQQPGAREDWLLPPRGRGGLFRDQELGDQSGAGEKAGKVSLEQQAELVARAQRGVIDAIPESFATGDRDLCDQVLTALVESAEDQTEKLRALVTCLLEQKNQRTNKKLIDSYLEMWKRSPDRRTTAELLHLAALSENAVVFEAAVNDVVRVWLRGETTHFTGHELLLLIESEYWALASEARHSGAGFVLKRSLAAIRRTLSPGDRAASI